MKRDLAEFTSTMQEDGSKMAATVKEKLTVCSQYNEYMHLVGLSLIYQ